MKVPGMIAGRYTVLRKIGAGAMGTVWLARDETLHRQVAIKQVTGLAYLYGGDDETARRRAIREGRVVARLNHPNAVTIYDVVTLDDRPCLVMEYVPSRTLTEVVRAGGPLPPGRVAAIGAQLADALAEAHRVGIVHRDVKPGNVLMTDSGTAKITDFGIARGGGDTLTETGLLAATPAYVAPEIARGADPSPASDVWSLGATLYFAVEGQPPFGTYGGNPVVLLARVASEPVPPPERAGRHAPVLMRLLSRDAAERPTMTEARALLAAVPPDQGANGAPAAAVPEVPSGADVTMPLRPGGGAAAVNGGRVADQPDGPPGVDGGPDGAPAGADGIVWAAPPPGGSSRSAGARRPSGSLAALGSPRARRASPAEPEGTAGPPGTAGPTRTAGAPAPPGSPRERRRPGRWLAAAVAVLLLALGGWYLLAGTPGTPASHQATPQPSTATSAPRTAASSPAPSSQPPASRPPASRPPATSAPATSAPATSAPAAPANPMQASAMTKFVADYYALLPENTVEGWSRLGPVLKRIGYDSYTSFWSTVRSVRTRNLSADPAHRAVSGTVIFVMNDGRTSTEWHRFTLVTDASGTGLLLNTDSAVNGLAGPTSGS